MAAKKKYSFVFVLIRPTSLVLKVLFFCILSVLTRLVRLISTTTKEYSFGPHLCIRSIEEKSPDFRSPEVGISAYHETASLKFHHLHVQMNSTSVYKCECIDYERQKENYLDNIPESKRSTDKDMIIIYCYKWNNEEENIDRFFISSRSKFDHSQLI